MVLRSLDPAWYSISGTNKKLPQDNLIDKETMKEIMDVLKAGHDRWKMSFNWKTEESTMRKYEEQIIEDFSEAFSNITERGLAKVEAVIDEHSRVSNLVRIRKLIKRMDKEDIDVNSIMELFRRENEKYQKMINQSDEIMRKEWDRFIEYQVKKDSMQKIIKTEQLVNLKDDVRKVNNEERQYRQRIAQLLEKIERKHELCRAALQLASGKLTPGDKDGRKLIEKMAEDAIQLKENLMKIIAFVHKGLLELKKRRRRKTGIRKSRGFIDEQCDLCQQREQDWEDERVKNPQYSEAMTARDARDFHTRLVRSGGMRGLVDQFKAILGDNPPANIALPKFVAGMAHPEKSEQLYKELVNYNCMKLLKNEIDNLKEETEKEKKRSLCGYDNDQLPYCIYCGCNEWPYKDSST